MKFGMTAGALIIALQFAFPAFAGTSTFNVNTGGADMKDSVSTLDAANKGDVDKDVQPAKAIEGLRATPILVGRCSLWHQVGNGR